MMKCVSIDEYNESERIACSNLPGSTREAFKASISWGLEYPVTITKERELERCLRDRTGGTWEKFYTEILDGITPDEFDLLQKLIGVLCDFTEEWFGKIILPT